MTKTAIQPKKEVSDSLLDLLIMAYVFGVEDVANSLDKKATVDEKKMNESVYKKIDGKTWVERLNEAETSDEIDRIIETESHRCFCEGQFDNSAGATHKTWWTQQDDRVRESHWYLDGLTVKVDEYFYTLGGDRALHPMGFGIPTEDINCRCYLEYSKREEKGAENEN